MAQTQSNKRSISLRGVPAQFLPVFALQLNKITILLSKKAYFCRIPAVSCAN